MRLILALSVTIALIALTFLFPLIWDWYVKLLNLPKDYYSFPYAICIILWAASFVLTIFLWLRVVDNIKNNQPK